MRNIKKVFLLVIMALLLSACNTNTYDYTGDELVYSFGEDATSDINSNGATVEVGNNQAFIEVSEDDYDIYTKGDRKIDKKDEYYKYYFVSLKKVSGNKFGSTQPITLQDETYGPLNINYYGIYDYEISNIKTFMEIYLKENNNSINDIQNYVKTHVVEALNNEILNVDIAYTEIASHSSAIVEEVTKSLQEKGILCSNFDIQEINLTEESHDKVRKISANNAMLKTLIQNTTWVATDNSEIQMFEKDFKWYQATGGYEDDFQYGDFSFYIDEMAVEFITQDLKSFGVTSTELEQLFASDEDFNQDNFVVFEINLVGYKIDGQETVVNSSIYWYGFLLNNNQNLQVVNMTTATYYNFVKKSA